MTETAILAGLPLGRTPMLPTVLAPAALSLQSAPADALMLVEMWDDLAESAGRLADIVGPLPSPGGAKTAGERRTLWWEPRTWLVRAPFRERIGLAASLGDAVAGAGAVTDVSGGFRRIRVQGPRWRELMMLGAVFDAEDATFAPGCVAGTVIHHAPVRLDVVAADIVDAYTPPSYATDLLHHWTAAQTRFSVNA